MARFRLIPLTYRYGPCYFEHHFRETGESWGVFDDKTHAKLAEVRTTEDAIAFVDSYSRAKNRALNRLSEHDRQLLGIR